MTEVLEPRCFTWDALAELGVVAEEATDVPTFFSEADRLMALPETTMALPFETGGLPHLGVSGERAQSEFDNAKALYLSLGAMPLVAGSDARLWTWLALGPFRDYMSDRWPLEGSRNWRGRLTERWLLRAGTATSGRLIRHGIARLWWLAELTHGSTSQEEADDEWHHLRVALSKEDIILHVFDRDAGAVPALRIAVLDQVAAWGPGAAEMAKSLMMEITLSFGYKDLSYLSVDDARELVKGLTG